MGLEHHSQMTVFMMGNQVIEYVITLDLSNGHIQLFDCGKHLSQSARRESMAINGLPSGACWFKAEAGAEIQQHP
jgi:hypothetical protein